MLQVIEKYLDVKFLKADSRKIGVNFITAGVVGVFINHFVGSKFSSMFWTSLWITSIGLILILFGVIRRNRE